jgi:DNA-binding GntR family transcriptional regulator
VTVRQSSTLSASIVATLKERIIAWQYPPEHRMTEEALCREFGVSRSPVREALRVLVTNGFIRRMPNRGYAVRQVSIKDIEELYDVRLALELYALESVTERGAPPKALATLRDTWQGVASEPDGRKGGELADLDTAFHETLAAFFGNDVLLEQLKSINERLYVFRMIDFDKPDRVESTCLQHVAIVDRIAARDVAGARAALRVNVEEGRSIVRSTVKEALARAYSIH